MRARIHRLTQSPTALVAPKADPAAAATFHLQRALGNSALARGVLRRQAAFGPAALDFELPLRLGGMTDAQLHARYDDIVFRLLTATQSSIQNEMLRREAGEIGAILARRAGRTFSPEAIARMRAYFEANAAKENPDSCIDTLNKGIRILLDDPKQKVGGTVDVTSAALAASGHAGPVREIGFLDANGRPTTGVVSPVKLRESVWDALVEMTGGDVGWNVFTMSLLDGYHSVTVSLDTSNPARPRAFWSDQWSTKGGFKEFGKAGFDAEIEQLTHDWWESEAAGEGETSAKTGTPVKMQTTVRLRRVRGTPQPVLEVAPPR
jgi:hypothetical protein